MVNLMLLANSEYYWPTSNGHKTNMFLEGMSLP